MATNPAWKLAVIQSLSVVSRGELERLRREYLALIQYHNDILEAIDAKLKDMGVDVNALQSEAAGNQAEDDSYATEKDKPT